ncbi:MAG TPA: PGPGW domain-containing protein [Actinomycetota bacterium]|nr:PGPGW domain-containing protein [Actinomycetota bacterium]
MPRDRRSQFWLKRHAVRVGVTIVGFVVLIAGVVMLVAPGPGVLVVIAGLALLATEYTWAEKFLHRAREKTEAGFHAATASPARIALSVALTLGAITAVILWWFYR